MCYDSLADYMNLAADKAHENAVKHGFYQDIQNLLDFCEVNDMPHYYDVARRDFVLAQLAKIDSEVGEAVACIQHTEEADGLAEELADIVIRVMDLSSWLNIPIGTAIEDKMAKNALRAFMHGKVC